MRATGARLVTSEHQHCLTGNGSLDFVRSVLSDKFHFRPARVDPPGAGGAVGRRPLAPAPELLLALRAEGSQLAPMAPDT